MSPDIAGMLKGLIADFGSVANGCGVNLDTVNGDALKTKNNSTLQWNWDEDQADRKREALADGEHPIQIDRRVLREVVKEKMSAEVVKIQFISAGTFHKAFMVYLDDGRELVARVARRFMPRLKTESEVATLNYLRLRTDIPVPTVYFYDANPYNRLGGEYILMSKAHGIPLSRVYHSLGHDALAALLKNLATLLIPLFGHRFSHIGSLYSGPSPHGDTDVDSKSSFDSRTPMNGHNHNFGSNINGNAAHFSHTPRNALSSASPSLSVQIPPRTPLSRTPTSASVPEAGAESSPSSASSSSRCIYPLTPVTEYSQSPLHHPHPYPQPHDHLGRSHSQTHVRAHPHEYHHHQPHQEGLSHSLRKRSHSYRNEAAGEFHVGPIISWPFFGGGRGELTHPDEIDRGPWKTHREYLSACVQREVAGVRRENDGSAKPHRLHLDPDQVTTRQFSWGANVNGAGNKTGDEEDNDDDDDDEDDSGEETESFGSDSDEDAMYRDYRKYQRTTFLVAHLVRREEQVREEMGRFLRCMDSLEVLLEETQSKERGRCKCDDKVCDVVCEKEKHGIGGMFGHLAAMENEEFGLDCHDISLENVFVDEVDHSKITCIIDWESTTTRPLWACAHLPSFLLCAHTSFAANLFRRIVATLPSHTYPHAQTWLRLESQGTALRFAHKFLEWDGWEEGLADSILGEQDANGDEPLVVGVRVPQGVHANGLNTTTGSAVLKKSGLSAFVHKDRLRTLDENGDTCGGRGGELGLRLEAWLKEGAKPITVGHRDQDSEYD